MKRPLSISRCFLWLVIAGLGVALLGALAAVAWSAAPILAARSQPPLVVSLAFPQDGDTVPLRSTLWVRGEIAGRTPAVSLELVVNGATWASTAMTPFDRRASWGWTPSGEGRHELTVIARTAGGQTYTSPTVTVFASAAADFRVPYQHTVLEGETLEGLGAIYDSSTEEILDANPALDPAAGVAPGDVVTIPMHVPTGPEQAPEVGSPAPPVGPLPENPPAKLPPQSDGTPLGDLVASLGLLLAPPGFTITNGILVSSQPVDQIYLYLAIADGPWQRVPKDPHQFIPATFGAFNLKPHIDFAALDNLPEPVLLKVEAWGWLGGTLVSLGSYSGYYGAGQLHWPYGGTDLQVFSHQLLGKKVYTTKANVSGDAGDWSLQFRWATQAAGVTGAVWQVSEKPLGSASGLNPPGLIHYGFEPGNHGEFTLNLRDYFHSPKMDSFLDELAEAIGGAAEVISGGSPPSKQFWPSFTRTFFVRVVPLGVAGGAQASNSVAVYFTPSGQPVPISGPLTGPVYDARILGFDPYLPPDPKYSACWVTNFEERDCRNVFGFGGGGHDPWVSIRPHDVASGKLTEAEYQQCQIRIPKGMHTCGCPGVSCSSSEPSCSLWDPSTYGNCIVKGVQQVGEWLSKGWEAFSGAYNKAVSLIKKMAAVLNPWCIQAKIAAAATGGEIVTEEEVQGVCEAVADIAVTAVMTYFGLPPNLPEFEKLMDEGLDYAIGLAVAEMGIDCNKQCRDLIKEGFETVASGENLLEKGLELGASMAADELRDLGVNCDAKCEQLIRQGAQGKASFGQVSDFAITQATADIVAKLNAAGYPCDKGCADVIENQLKQGAAIGGLAADAAASKSYEPLLLPHPLSAEQPAIVRIEVFRRWESAEIPDSELQRCGLSLDNLVANQVAGATMSGRLFDPIGIELPVLDPGETMVVPVLLNRAGVPVEVMKAMNPSGQPVPLPGVGNAADIAGWFNFYSRGQITLRAWGPPFISSTSPKALPCVDEVSRIFDLPDIGIYVTFP